MNLTLLIIGMTLLAIAARGLNFAQAAHGFRDMALKVRRALPDGAAAVTSESIDLRHNASGSHLAPSEFELVAPALNATQMPDAKTMTYAVMQSDAANMAGATVVSDAVLVQTGADGAGAAGSSVRFRVPSNIKRYIAVRATGSAGGDATGADFTVQLVV